MTKAFKSVNDETLDLLSITSDNDCKINEMLSKWHNVIAYYNICQMVAPVIESAILLDRMLYLFENGELSLYLHYFRFS